MRHVQQRKQEDQGSNCTFMELKYVTPIVFNSLLMVLIVPLWNWNKYRHNLASSAESVLIVPLWNWNDIVEHMQVQQNCSNCTFMELKYEVASIKAAEDARSNCTFMELKLESWVITLESVRQVLIVPLWNWNTKTKIK